MEEWRELSDDDDDVDAVADYGGAEENFSFDLDFQLDKFRFDSCKERLRSLFDQVFIAFMRDKCARKCNRPIPALCGDGRPVDLFKLYWLVRKVGGYDTVSKSNLWGFVSDECGLGVGLIASVKLIYMKYLNDLDQWLQQEFSKRVLEDDYSGFVHKLDLLSWKLETRFRGLLLDKQEQEEQEKYIKSLTYSRNDITLDIHETKFRFPNTVTRLQGENAVTFIEEDKHSQSGYEHSQLSSGRVYQNIISGIGDIDQSIDDTYPEKTVNEVNSFCNRQIDADTEKTCSEDNSGIVASAIKIIEKVVDNVLIREKTIAAAADVNDGRFPVEDKVVACISAKKSVNKVNFKKINHSEKITDNEEGFSGTQIIGNVMKSRADVGNLLDSRKRKREFNSFSGMLSWLIHAAKYSNDPSIGLIPGFSKWGDYGNEAFWAQVLLVRGALLIRRHANKTGEDPLKDQHKKQRMHPSMYEDDILDLRSTEKLRVSKRIPLTKSHICPCCKSCPDPQNKEMIHRRVVSPKAPLKLDVREGEELHSNKNDQKSPNEPVEKEVSVGPHFQAKVPKWTGVPSKSDSKWLGSKMWSPEDGEENSTVRLHPHGTGHHPCNCPFPDSVECVRFHVAEKRLKLRQELGLLFYRWRFNCMGEEVSLSWTEKEEKAFKDNIRSYAAFSNKFWDSAWRFLPSKTREQLVSYYYNVYLVQRRSYQNRVTPKDVDSDDDEKDCGSIGGSFGCKALSVSGSGSILCTLNKESNELI